MKITADYEGRDDEYDNETIRFYEEVDDEGYFYEVYVLIDGGKAAVIITDEGVSVQWRAGEKEGGSIITPLTPEKIFPNQKDLTWDDIQKILKILIGMDRKSGAIGEYHSPDGMKELYEQFKKETGYVDDK